MTRSSMMRFALGLGALTATTAGIAEYRFQGIGGFPSPDVQSVANGVSADGLVVVGSANLGNGLQAVRWTRAAGFTPIGDLPGGSASAFASAISADGRFIVGQSSSSNGFEAFLWSGRGIIGLGDLPGTGGFSSFANAVSNGAGVVVGATQRPFGPPQYAAFRWTPATGMQHLGEFAGGDNFSIANDVSADGSVIVGVSSGPEGSEAFKWTQSAGMIGLGELPGGIFGSRAQGVSLDGTIIVGSSASSQGSEAVRWTAHGMVGLGDFPGGNFSSAATGVSADGSVIVGTASGFIEHEGFLWMADLGMASLKQYLRQHGVSSVEGWSLLYVNGVSADGKTIVGTGLNPQGRFEGWVATIEHDNTPVDMGEVVPPTSLSVPLGHVSGALSEVVKSDDLYLRMRARGKDLMQAVFEGTLTRTAVSALQLEIESYTTRFGTKRQTELFDFTTGSWAVISTVGVPTWEGYGYVTITSDPQRYVQPGTLKVRARMSWYNPSARGGQQTEVFVDKFAFTRVP